MKNLGLILLIGIGFHAFSQSELKEGVQYPENTSLVVSVMGITLKIPSGWSGGVPVGSSTLLLSDGSNESTIFVTADYLEEDKVLEYLRNEISLEQGVSLIPVGHVQQQGKRWSGEYRVNGVSLTMQGYVEVRLGKSNIGVGCVVISLPNAFEKGKSGAIELLNSIQFTEPNNSNNTKAAGINQSWDQYLKGRSLRYYYSQGDFSETDFIHLCATGSFNRSKRSSSGGSTGYGAVSGNNQGTWNALGEGDTGKLILRFDDGTQAEFQIQYGQGNKGLGIYLNGSRYYAEISNQCP